MREKPGEYVGVCGDKRALGAVAASEVLGGNDRNRVATLRLHQQNLAVVISEVCALYNLGDERPQFERLVGGLVVENKVNATDLISLADEEKAAQKFLGYGERGLPHLGIADLLQNPFEDVGHLNRVAQISLIRLLDERS